MSDITQQLEDLGGPDPGRRAAAAALLYRAGCERAADVFAEWRKDPEFDVLVTGRPIVGVAVPPDLFVRIRQETGMPDLAEVPADQSTAEFEMNRGEIRLDILTPVDGGGPIQKFLDRFGPGIQQVELPVAKVEQAGHILSARFGLAAVYPEPRAGADGTRVNFYLVNAPAAGKLLIELFEAKR